jgi:hypothetical protein
MSEQFPTSSAMSVESSTSTPQSTATPPAGNSSATLPAAHNLEAIIAGVTYHLPSPGQSAIEVLLADGSIAQLLADRVIIHTQVLIIPPGLSLAQQLSIEGQTITAQPGASTKPSGGGKGEKGLFGAFAGLVGGAKAATGSIGNLGKGALDFASGAGGAAAAISSPLSGAIGNVDSIVSSLNGIQEMFPGEEMGQKGMDVFSHVQTLGRQTLDQMKSLEGVLPGFSNLPAGTQNSVRAKAGEIAAKGGLLDQVRASHNSSRQASSGWSILISCYDPFP